MEEKVSIFELKDKDRFRFGRKPYVFVLVGHNKVENDKITIMFAPEKHLESIYDLTLRKTTLVYKIISNKEEKT